MPKDFILYALFWRAFFIRNPSLPYLKILFHRGQNTIKFVQNEKKPPKAMVFSDFLLIFAMSLMNFSCFDLQH